MPRCAWAEGSDLYRQYHDSEWGVPSHNDRHLFEMLILEGAQAGLSWSTILNRREGYRKAYENFDVKKVAAFTDARQRKLLQDPGIVRNRAKVAASVLNAQAFLQIQKEFGSFDAYLWGFVGGKPIQNSWKSLSQIRAESEISKALSKDLQNRGFKFVGSTIMYAFMQAVGMVNDHLLDCPRWRACRKLRKLRAPERS
jgi:DNA-3-methyladenine glycosylase I